MILGLGVTALIFWLLFYQEKSDINNIIVPAKGDRGNYGS
jgi:hypothetical protein